MQVAVAPLANWEGVQFTPVSRATTPRERAVVTLVPPADALSMAVLLEITATVAAKFPELNPAGIEIVDGTATLELLLESATG